MRLFPPALGMMWGTGNAPVAGGSCGRTMAGLNFPSTAQQPGGSPHLCAGSRASTGACGGGQGGSKLWGCSPTLPRGGGGCLQKLHSSLLFFPRFFFFFPQKKAIQALELIKQRTERLGCAGCSYESNSALRGKQFGFSKAAPCAVPHSASALGQTQGLGGLFCTPQDTPQAPPCLGLMGGAGLSSVPALPRGFAMQQMPGLCQLLAKRTWLCHAATSCLLPAVYKL